MLYITTCKNCKKTEHLIFELKWKYKEEYCDKCKKLHHSSKTYYFCSHKCLLEWLKKAKKCLHENKHEWESDSSISNFSKLKRKMVCISEYCKICGLRRFINKKI